MKKNLFQMSLPLVSPSQRKDPELARDVLSDSETGLQVEESISAKFPLSPDPADRILLEELVGDRFELAGFGAEELSNISESSGVVSGLTSR